jgi:hypothetical protein
MFVRRHLEACVLSYLAEELRTGDIAVVGADTYANWADQLLSVQECARLLPGFCAEVGIPADGPGFRADLEARLRHHAGECDAGYLDNTDLVIDDTGVPSLKRYRAAPVPESATALEAAIAERMPERTLLGILARTAHWLEWWRRFGPASGSDPKNHYEDLMRVVLSIQAGKISSVTLLRRLSTYSRRNNFYRAFREVGRVIRTVALLRYLSDAQLRTRTTAATNKVESYNQFVSWCRFGNHGVIADNDPDEQEKIVKFSTLLANCVIFHTAVDMTVVIRDLVAEGWRITAEDLAALSPYLTAHIQRFGTYATDEVTLAPDAYDARLGVELGLPPLGCGSRTVARVPGARGPATARWCPVAGRAW